jgi:YD repeat-containing protein
MSSPFLPGSHTFSYNYDAAGRLTNLQNPNGLVGSWTYSADNIVQQLQLGNGAITNFAHNALGQLTSLTNLAPGGLTTLSSFSNLTHDGMGNLISLTASVPAVPSLSGTNTFGYDGKDQLLNDISTRHGGYTHSYIYDTAGNPTTFNGVNHTFNATNEITYTGSWY